MLCPSFNAIFFNLTIKQINTLIEKIFYFKIRIDDYTVPELIFCLFFCLAKSLKSAIFSRFIVVFERCKMTSAN